MGIAIPDFEDPNFGAGNDDNDDDSDLQAELERMENGGGSSSKARPKPNQKKPGILVTDETLTNHFYSQTHLF